MPGCAGMTKNTGGLLPQNSRLPAVDTPCIAIFRAFALDRAEGSETRLALEGRKEENLMADGAELSCGSTRRSSKRSFPMNRKAPLPGILVAAAFALAGCNANQTPNPSSQASLGEIYPDYNPYDPSKYAQTSGFYAGR